MDSTLEVALRQFLLSAGGAVVTHGYLTQGQWETCAGAIAIVAAVAWKHVKLYLAKRKAANGAPNVQAGK